MKIFAFILGIFITFLSLSSGFVKDDCDEDIPYAQNSSENHKKDGCNSCCPFMCTHACCSFLVSVKEIWVSDDVVEHFYSNPFISYKSDIVEEFYSSIWQPPKQF